MIPPRNPWYRNALAGSHEAYARVEVWRSGVKVDELVWVDRSAPYSSSVPVFFGGSIRATLGSRVTRQLTLTVPDYLYPWKTTDLLNPYGQELRVFKGIRYGNNSPDEFAAFTGTIEQVRPVRNGVATLDAADTALRVSGAGFESPTPAQDGDPIVDEFERIVLDADPSAQFGTHDTFVERVPVLSYDSDRGAALDSLAKAASANWYTLADGRYVLRRVPWTADLTSAPIFLTDGDGGTLVDAYPTRSTSGIYNQVTVLSDRADGGAVLYATASDTDVTSPTWVGGPFGVRTLQVRVTGAANQQQLLSLAGTILQRSKVLTEAWQVSCIPDASIELGDALDLTFRGHHVVQFVSGFTMPLEPSGTMSVDCRDLLSGEDS
jgi:hypothetical protein